MSFQQIIHPQYSSRCFGNLTYIFWTGAQNTSLVSGLFAVEMAFYLLSKSYLFNCVSGRSGQIHESRLLKFQLIFEITKIPNFFVNNLVPCLIMISSGRLSEGSTQQLLNTDEQLLIPAGCQVCISPVQDVLSCLLKNALMKILIFLILYSNENPKFPDISHFHCSLKSEKSELPACRN